MSEIFDVKFMQSAKGRHPIARFRLKRDECNAYSYTKCGRKDEETLYHGCNQCKSVDRKAKGCKQITLKGASIVNGDPTIRHQGAFTSMNGVMRSHFCQDKRLFCLYF